MTLRILMVENHAEFGAIVAGSFLADHAVTQVPSITAAKEQLALQAFDLVLVDYDLDDGKGDEVVRHVVASDGPPCIAISSHEDGNTALRATGAVATCSKMEFSRIGEVLAEVVG